VNIFGKKANKMENNTVRVSEKIIGEIERHGEESYPEECCGILLGFNGIDGRRVQEIKKIDNSQVENRRRRFLVTPEQYLRAENIAQELNMELLGFYHSHPDHFAVPSNFDTEHALPWFTYIIVSVKNGKSGTTSAWRLNEGHSQFSEELIIKDSYDPKYSSSSSSYVFE
jgi:proteasome lid subunit RPN8/RPN11